MVFGLSKEEADEVWLAIEKQQLEYKEGLRTRYNNDPAYTDAEDGSFLRHHIQICDQVRSKMVAMGYQRP